MEVHTIYGSTGVFLLLLAYFLNLIKKLDSDGFWYGLLNTTGALLAAWSSYLIGFIPFIILEGTWAMVSAVSLFRSWAGLKLKK